MKIDINSRWAVHARVYLDDELQGFVFFADEEAGLIKTQKLVEGLMVPDATLYGVVRIEGVPDHAR